MKEKISVACCQLALRVGEAEHNRALSAQAIRRAAQHGANVIVLPELVNSGYVLRDKAEALALAEAEDGPSLSLWGDWRVSWMWRSSPVSASACPRVRWPTARH